MGAGCFSSSELAAKQLKDLEAARSWGSSHGDMVCNSAALVGDRLSDFGLADGTIDVSSKSFVGWFRQHVQVAQKAFNR